MTVLGGPVGTTVPQYVRLPRRSEVIPVSLVRALGRDGARIRLTPLRVRPTISRVHGIAKLRQWGDAKKRLASFLNARTGKGIEALTINGWKPQLPEG